MSELKKNKKMQQVYLGLLYVYVYYYCAYNSKYYILTSILKQSTTKATYVLDQTVENMNEHEKKKRLFYKKMYKCNIIFNRIIQ